jgi:hypothetical protein
MSFGELTVTLQDASYLWDFSITGDHIIGPSDQDLQQLIEINLGVDMNRALLKSMKKKGGDNDDEVVQSGYQISLNLLRAKFKKLDDNATDELSFLMCLVQFFSQMHQEIVFR